MLRYTYIAPLVVDSDDVTITVRLTAVLDVVIPLFFFNTVFRKRGGFCDEVEKEEKNHILMDLFERSSQHYQWLRRVVSGFSPRSRGFSLQPINIGFVVDKVALGHDLLRVLWFSPVSIFPPDSVFETL